jgi:RNA polymerase sigma-70 factor (sigma-E family)
MLLRLASAITGNFSDAQDLAQTTLLKVYLAWDQIIDKGATDAYVRRVMANAGISSWRRRKIAEYPLDDLLDRAAVSDPFDECDIRRALLSALSKLTKRQRAIVMLRYYADLTEGETAAALRVSVGTVKSTTHHALAKLRVDAALRAQVGPDQPQLAMAS